VTGMLRHALACFLLAALVLGIGLLLAGPESVPGVLAGTGIGLAFQVVVVGGLLAALFGGQPMVLFGLGMVGRIVLLAVTALVVVPAFRLPAPATLFSLVSVLFLTTLSEPLVFRAEPEPSR
jgi:4-amino-4-deoxy-L-arabinose transferase-like glycosyltransferase